MKDITKVRISYKTAKFLYYAGFRMENPEFMYSKEIGILTPMKSLEDYDDTLVDSKFIACPDIPAIRAWIENQGYEFRVSPMNLQTVIYIGRCFKNNKESYSVSSDDLSRCVDKCIQRICEHIKPSAGIDIMPTSSNPHVNYEIACMIKELGYHPMHAEYIFFQMPDDMVTVRSRSDGLVSQLTEQCVTRTNATSWENARYWLITAHGVDIVITPVYTHGHKEYSYSVIYSNPCVVTSYSSENYNNYQEALEAAITEVCHTLIKQKNNGI